jgi:hypothetical protein
VVQGRLRHFHRIEHDVVVIYVDWDLQNEADLPAWVDAYEQLFQQFQSKVDIIIDLSNFRVSPRMASHFGEARAKVLERYTRRSYRVNINPIAKAMMYTSNVLYGAAANDCPSMEAAIDALLADRARDAT